AVPVRTKPSPAVTEAPSSFRSARPPEPPFAALSAAEVEANQAVERGVKYLQQFLEGDADGQRRDRRYSREGILALVAFTLLECGVPAEDSAIQAVAATLRDGER